MTLNELILKLLTAEKLTIRLLQSNGQEISGGGYIPKQMKAGDWQVDGTLITGEAQVWEFEAPIGDVAGFQIVHGSGAEFPAEYFDTPYLIGGEGDTITIVPKYQFKVD